MSLEEEKKFIRKKSPVDFFKKSNGKESKKFHKCDYPGCCNEGEYRAPKNRDNLRDYYWFCLEHVKAYNKSWDYYEGMSEIEFELDRRGSVYGHRPTWASTGRVNSDELLKKVFDAFGTEDDTAYSQNLQKNTPELKALWDLGLKPPTNFTTIKKRYRQLVKKYHPDVNNSDVRYEEKIKKINAAYQLLKTTYN